jgi:hypothetical protein
MTDRLIALLDTLLPGDGADWPAAGAHGLAVRTATLADDMPGGAEAMAGVLDALPQSFADLPQLRREEFLSEIEVQDVARFDAVVTAAYNAYYTDPAIRDIVERTSGYPNRPPQPEGYALDPFDESLLDAVKARGPIWRPVE